MLLLLLSQTLTHSSSNILECNVLHFTLDIGLHISKVTFETLKFYFVDIDDFKKLIISCELSLPSDILKSTMLTSVTGIMGEGARVIKVPMDMFVDKCNGK